MANRVKLNICGVSCVLITDESEEYMAQLGREAEGLILSLMRTSGSLPVAAVTAALSYLDDLKKAGNTASDRGETEELKAKLAALFEMNEALRSENKQLRELGRTPRKETAAGYENPLRHNEMEKDGMITFYAKEQ